MLILGFLLIAGGALLILASVFTADVVGGAVEVIGIGVSPVTLFLMGVASGVAILWGLGISKFGAKRELAQRKERRKINDLSEKLDRADADRRRDPDEDDGRHNI